MFFTLSSSSKAQLLAAVCVNLIAFTHGTVMGWLSPYLPVLLSSESPLSTGPLTIDEVSWIGALVCVGGFLGNFIYGYISDKFGRKTSLLLLIFPQLGFWVMIIFATEVYQLYIARVLSGITGAGVFITIPLYIADIAEPDIRGMLGSILLLFLNFGILFSFTVGLFVKYHIYPLIIIPIPITYFIIFTFFPETPQSLLYNQKYIAAEKSLKFYRGMKNIETKKHKEEFNRMILQAERNTNVEKKLSYELKDFTNKPAIYALTCSLVVISLNTFSGGFTIIQYAAKVFQDSGCTISPGLSSIIVAICQILGTYTTTILVDRLGRKMLLVVSAIGTSLGFSMMGMFSFLQSQNYDVSSYSLIPVISLSFVIYMGCIGIVPLPFVVVAELLPSKIRSVGSTFLFGTLTIITFTLLKLFPIINAKIGLFASMWMFAFVCTLGTFFIIFVLPETKGKVLDDEKVDIKRTTI